MTILVGQRCYVAVCNIYAIWNTLQTALNFNAVCRVPVNWETEKNRKETKRNGKKKNEKKTRRKVTKRNEKKKTKRKKTKTK